MSVGQHSLSRIELVNVSQSFVSNQVTITLFKQLNLSVAQGQSYAIVGPSGSGKSTLLTLMSGLAEPSTGRCLYHGEGGVKPISAMRQKIGFVFQQFHLLPELTALNNVALPLKLRGDRKALERAEHWLDKVGLTHRAQHKPAQLSGGEQQRVAIARALVFEPEYIFADEPTGNLDSYCARDVADILFQCCEDNHAGLVIVTHSQQLAAQTQEVFSFHKGHVQPTATPLKEVQYG